jgi:hypothetical protein
MAKGMKKVRFSFGALTRVEANVEREVPEDISYDDIKDLANQIYESLDASAFVKDHDYFKRQSTVVHEPDSEWHLWDVEL